MYQHFIPFYGYTPLKHFLKVENGSSRTRDWATEREAKAWLPLDFQFKKNLLRKILRYYSACFQRKKSKKSVRRKTRDSWLSLREREPFFMTGAVETRHHWGEPWNWDLRPSEFVGASLHFRWVSVGHAPLKSTGQDKLIFQNHSHG